MRCAFAQLCFFAFGLTTAAYAGEWVKSEEYGNARIVVPNAPTAAEREAADLFATTWERMTGHPVARASAPGVGLNAWIGSSLLPETWKSALKLDELGFDGVALRTMPATEGKNLVLTGRGDFPRDKGVVFATYEFFEHYCGVRWLAPGVTHIPPAPKSIPAIDSRYTPPLAFRDIGGLSARDASAYRKNSPFQYGLRYHTFYTLLPPEKYFAEHPEYYSEINGKRIAPVGFDWDNISVALAHPNEIGQLCMSNPDVAKALARELEERIRKEPDANLWAVSQMDWGNPCQCPRCRAIDDAEGSPAASILTGVNRVADLIEKDFPNVSIQTYAYTWSRRPPKTLRPRHNVIIQFCSIECDFARAFDDPTSKINRAFIEDLDGWQKLGANILLYNYPVNCTDRLHPYPYEYVFAKNMQYLVKQKAIGAFEQGLWGKAAAFGYLKPYVMGKVFWNPNVDVDKVVDEFCDLYYGAAGRDMRAYFDLCHETLRRSKAQMFLFDDDAWIDADFVKKAEAIFARAFKAADSDEIHKRVDLDYFQVQYAAHYCTPSFRYLDNWLVIDRPAAPTPDQMLARMDALGIPDNSRDDHKRAVFPSGMRKTPLIRLENNRYLVWVAPELAGSILRWRDKKLGVELLKGFETCGIGRGVYQEWSAYPGLGDAPSAPTYAIKEQSPQRATIEGTSVSALVITRTMSLEGADGGLRIETRFTNGADAPQPLPARIHPEFYCQRAGDVPEFWMRAAEGWKQIVDETQKGNTLGVGKLTPDPAGEWAATLRNGKFSLMNRYDAAQLESLIYFYNTGAGTAQVNLELIPPSKELRPGESCAITTTYWIEKGRPDRVR